MSVSNGRLNPAPGRLIIGAIATMAMAAGIAFVWTSVETVSTRREIAEQAANNRCQDASDSNCKQLAADIRAAVAAEDAADFAGQQLWLNIIGLLGLGATVIYARGAWREAQRSADAAHGALESSEADAAERAAQFRQQLKIAKESVEAARQSVINTDRAWLQLTINHVGPLVFDEDEDEVILDLSITCENIGKAPAIGVVWARKMFGSAGDAHQYVSESTRHTYFGASALAGDVMFPGETDDHQHSLTMRRTDFIDACKRLASDPDLDWDRGERSHPSIIIGVHYALPGDNRRRFTYKSFFIVQHRTEGGDFDGSDDTFQMNEIHWRSDGLRVPIT